MVITTFLDQMLGFPAAGQWHAQAPAPAELTRRFEALAGRYRADGRDDAEDRTSAESGPHREEEALRLLVRSGRLSEAEVREMVEHLVLVLDSDWLPCRDDPQRDQMPVSQPARAPKVPPARYRCPLQVRALLGDPTVPCAEALSVHPPESLVREVRRRYPAGAGNRRRPDLVPYWTGEADRPGGPEDVVRRLGLRPCHLLGLTAAMGIVNVITQAVDEAKHAQDLAEFLRP
jgi:hypothetical protein